jgi:cytochrome c oxidase subunit 1
MRHSFRLQPPTAMYRPTLSCFSHLLLFISGIFATMIRIPPAHPEVLAVTPETYNKLFTMRRMPVFFFPHSIHPRGPRQLSYPLMIGAKDVAFPAQPLELVHLHHRRVSFSIPLLPVVWMPLDLYTPLSVYSNSQVTPAVISIFINGFSSILTGMNFVVTIHTMRAPGMTWFRLPLFVWAHCATIIFILGTPVIAIHSSSLGSNGCSTSAFSTDPRRRSRLFQRVSGFTRTRLFTS